MKKSVKVFLLVLCGLLAVGLICIGCGVMMGGDFSAITAKIMGDFWNYFDSNVIVPPTVS